MTASIVAPIPKAPRQATSDTAARAPRAPSENMVHWRGPEPRAIHAGANGHRAEQHADKPARELVQAKCQRHDADAGERQQAQGEMRHPGGYLQLFRGQVHQQRHSARYEQDEEANADSGRGALDQVGKYLVTA